MGLGASATQLKPYTSAIALRKQRIAWEDGMVIRVVSSGNTAEARAAAERLAESRG